MPSKHDAKDGDTLFSQMESAPEYLFQELIRSKYLRVLTMVPECKCVRFPSMWPPSISQILHVAHSRGNGDVCSAQEEKLSRWVH